jgi:hypothetical protein
LISDIEAAIARWKRGDASSLGKRLARLPDLPR